MQRGVERRQRDAQRLGKGRSCPRPRLRVGSGQPRQQRRQTGGRLAAGTGVLVGELRQHFCGLGQRRDGLRVGGRRFWRRVQRRGERSGGAADRGELRVLVGRDEAGEGRRAGHLGKRGETRRGFLGRLQIGFQQLDRVRAGLRVLAQFEKRRDRLGLRALQVQRVEIEAQPVEERRAEHDRADRQRDDRPAVTLQETIDRRERGHAHRRRLGRRVQHRDQRRHQRDAGQERDDHAASGDQTELRQAAIRGRDEGEKAERGRGGGQRQRPAGLARRVQQRRTQRAGIIALGAVADRVLQAEIDAEPDEQHEERDRERVQRADQQQAERRGDR